MTAPARTRTGGTTTARQKAGNAAARRRPAKPRPTAAAAPPPPPVDDDAEWLGKARLEVLQCRDLRHCWPRQETETGKRRGKAVLPVDSKNITWKILEKGPPVTLERTMNCEGKCGVRRVEVFVVRPGSRRLVRVGVPSMRYPKDYKRPKPDDDAPPRDRIDVDVLRGSILARLVPGLKW